MATIVKFEDLEIWQNARMLNQSVFKLLEELDSKKSFALKDQLDRSAGSVMDNIAEGFERGGNREFLQFLSISKASLGEVRSQLYRAHDRKYLAKDEFETYQTECLNLAGKIAKFMTYLRNSEYKGEKYKQAKN